MKTSRRGFFGLLGGAVASKYLPLKTPAPTTDIISEAATAIGRRAAHTVDRLITTELSRQYYNRAGLKQLQAKFKFTDFKSTLPEYEGKKIQLFRRNV